MKVLEVFGEPIASGGQEAFVFNVLRHIDRSDLSIDFFTPYSCSNDCYRRLISDCGGKLFCAGLPFAPGKSRSNIVRPLREVLENENYNAVHIHSGSITVLAYASYAAAKSGVGNIIVHSHVTAPRKTVKYRLTKAWGALFFKRYPTQFCACSKAAGESKFPYSIVKSKLRVIANGIDLARFAFYPEKRRKYRQKMALSDDTLVIGHVGRFSEQKNHRFDLDILEELKKNTRNDIRLLWIGEGELEDELRKLTEKKSLQDSVIFQGVVMNVEDYLQAMDVFILPSLFEGLAIVGVEAQAAGLPVLASDRVSEDMKLTESVRFLPLGNAEKWAEEILHCQGERHPENTVQIAGKGYSIEETAKQVRNLYFS